MSRQQRIFILRGFAAAIVATIAIKIFYPPIAYLITADWPANFSGWIQQLSLMDIVTIAGNSVTAILAWRYFATVVRKNAVVNKASSLGSCIEPLGEQEATIPETPNTTVSRPINSQIEINEQQQVRTRSGT